MMTYLTLSLPQYRATSGAPAGMPGPALGPVFARINRRTEYDRENQRDELTDHTAQGIRDEVDLADL